MTTDWLRWTLVIIGLVLPSSANAGDWPQILGPGRNGIAAADERLRDNWKVPPRVQWQKDVGAGYAGPVVTQGVVVLFHRIDSDEVVECLDAQTGERRWKHESFTSFRPQVGGGDGPLCTPTVHGDRVITYGAQGVLTCLNLKDGSVNWSRKTHEEFRASEGYFGAGSTPVVVGKMVVVNVGGSVRESGIVGFDLESGEPKWRQTSEQGSYSAPVVTQVDGLDRVIAVTRLKCVGLDPTTGSIWFQFPFGSRGPTVNGASPVLLPDNRLFLTSSYGVGSTYGELSFLGFNQTYTGDEVFASQYCTPVFHNGLLFGVDGRDDLPPADLKCFEPDTRKVRWSEQNFGYGTVILCDRKLLILRTEGDLVLAEASGERYVELGRTTLFRTTTRALPALADGKLYARDESVLKCVELGPAKR